MREQKGITLDSLAIYIVVIMVVIGIMSTVTSTFYNNMQNIDTEGEFALEYGKLNSSLINDIRQNDAKLVEVSEDNKTIRLYNINTEEEVTYTFLDTGVYRNQTLISKKLTGTIKKDTNNENLVSILLEYIGKDAQNYNKILDFYFEK